MQNNTQTIVWVALSLFIAVMILFIAKPSIENGTTSITGQFETVTSGGEWNPDDDWMPGS